MTEPIQPMRSESRHRAWLAGGLAIVAFGIAIALLVGKSTPAARHISVTAGFEGTTRALVAHVLAYELKHRGLDVDVVYSASTSDELAHVNASEIDFALVSGAFRHRGFPNVREVASLFPEALHLLVKAEFADQVGASLGGLRGLRVDLGPRASATEGLAAAVLGFAGVTCAPVPAAESCTATNLQVDELERLLLQGEDREVLPDAIFHLATVPSLVATQLVRERGYLLVALPFAEAFRLGAMLEDLSTPESVGEIERRYSMEVVIPPFTYQTDPPVPAEKLVTVGARLLLVANENVSQPTVEKVLDAIFDSRFSRIPQPPLERALLELPPRHPLHEGTIAFLGRNRPWISGGQVDRLANTLSVLGALVGGGLFLWQSWRQRVSARRDELFGQYQLRIASLERRIAELELAAELALEPLITLQRDLLTLKSEALARYASGELGNQATLTDLLVPLNAARDHVASLLLHVRQNLEEQAETEGRTTQDVWDEAAERSEEPQTGP
jgi:TRAP-type uncharacterized transport system substrate-binding protein